MASVYTTQIVMHQYAGPFTNTVVFTVPAGTFLIVTDIDTQLNNTGAGQLSYVTIGQLPLLYRSSPGAEAINQQWTGRQALNAAQSIKFTFNGSTASLGVTGYLLNI